MTIVIEFKITSQNWRKIYRVINATSDKKPNAGIDFFKAPLKLHSHLHVGTSPLQKPLGPHILLFDPISIYPFGQT